MGCLDNLKKCNAICCREIAFLFPSLSKDKENYYKLHGCKVLRLPNRTYKIIVPLKCTALGEDNLCILHESGEKPIACRRLDKSTSKDYHVDETCIFK